MISNSFLSMIFVLQLVVILFLMFQVQSMTNFNRDWRSSEQDNIAKAARLVVKSATQNHKLFSHEHAIEAKIIVNEIIHRHGGVTAAEKNLKLPKGKLESLKNHINIQLQDVQSYLMEEIIKSNPVFDTDLNEMANLRKRKKTKPFKKT